MLTTMKQFQIMKELDTYCKKDAQGYAVYKGKCSDKIIAKKFKVNESTIASYRKKIVGNLRMGAPSGKRTGYDEKGIRTIIENLSNQVLHLEGKLETVLKHIAEQQQTASALANKLDKEDNQKQAVASEMPRPIIHLP